MTGKETELTEIQLELLREDAQKDDKLGAVARALLDLEGGSSSEGIEWR